MSWFKNMKISVKIITGFIIVALLAGVIGVISFTNLTTLTTQYKNLYNNYGLPLSTVGEIQLLVERNRAELRSMIIDKAENIPTYEKNISDNADQVTAMMTDFKKTLQTDEAKAKFAEVDQALTPYREKRNEIITLIKDGKKDQAFEKLTNELVQASKPVIDGLQSLTDSKTENGKQTEARLTALAESTKTLIIGIICIAVVLAVLIGLLISRSISKPVRKLVEGANRLAAGDIGITMDYTGRDEVAMLRKSFGTVIDTLKSLITEMNHMSEQHDLGDIDVTVPEENFEGAYRQMAAGVNKMVMGHIAVKKKAMACVAEFSRGNFEAPLERFPGKKAFINENIELLRTNLKALIADTNTLVEAGVDGRLSTRADASKHQGDFRKIVDGVNRTLDAVIEPVNEASAVLGEMSRGNLGVNVIGDYKGDHAVIKNALNDTINTVKGYIDEISQVLTGVAAGNLTIGIQTEYRGDFVQIKDSINNIIDSLNDVMGEISAAAEQVAAGTQQVSSGSQALSQGATEQASAIEELTVSVSEIATQTKDNAVNANQANDLALTARDSAVNGNNQMRDMQQSMAGINEASASISKIIKVIDDIAFQTNLLALNAAVEAARAGQHGKGFAVVAEEVRNLAQRSAAAAKETTELIEESVKKVKDGTQMADDTASALNSIVTGVEKATNLVSGIAKASSDQATAVAQVNRGIEQVSQVVQTNSATAEESAAASEELSSQAALLKEMVGRFTLRSQAANAKAQSAFPANELKKLQQPQAAAGKPQIKLNAQEFGKY